MAATSAMSFNVAPLNYTPHSYAPAIPSPLSPRRSRPHQISPSNTSNPPSPVAFSKRPIRANPALQSRDVVKERRRDLFLKKVQQGRDNRKWEARGDQMMRLDFMSRQKRWEAEQARHAPLLSDPPEDDDMDEYDAPLLSSQASTHPSCSSQCTQSASNPTTPTIHAVPDNEVDVILQQEDEELDALVSMLESEQHERNQQRKAQDASYGSDEEDYDSFMDFIDDGMVAQKSSERTSEDEQGSDEMDTTIG
ncbi:hypothetical protein B0A49_05716 [Cryomyces minteri]|uniref:Uncharacterized protein n=1 Tax=Cryomyces minteri TaxID=331657 RepID=A0A4U0WQ44_9PEZI|nr:hypothetical protein B0A49_05716 [Cryomyces minteri]